MENEPESASALAWLWVIEALASFKEVNISLLHDVIETAPELPDDTAKNAGEMVALRCLEGFFGPIDGIGKDGPPTQYAKVTFDPSQSCEDVLKRIIYETSESALTVGGPEMLKWDVRPFIAQKRACMRSNLQQLKDSILDGSHPYVDFLMEKSGLASVNKKDSKSVNNNHHTELNSRLDSSPSDLQIQNQKSKQSPLLPADHGRLSVEDRVSFSLLPSKRSRVEFSTEDEERQLPGCDNVHMKFKKLKHLIRTSYSGKEASSPHGAELLEDTAERGIPLKERDDSSHLDEHLMGTLEEGILVEECSGSMRSGWCTDELHQEQSGIPCNTMTADPFAGEPCRIIGVVEGKDRIEFPFEPKASNNSPVESTLHKTSKDDFKCGLGHEHHIETTTMFQSGSMPKAIATDTNVNTSLYEEEKDASNDSDSFYNERIDIFKKKNEFFSSQCMVNRDSFESVDGPKVNVCMKCNEGGQLLSCNISDCPFVVHEKCLGSSVTINDADDFCCPFCVYSLAISEYLEAKKKVTFTRKSLATFIHIGLGHQPTVIKGIAPKRSCSKWRSSGCC